MEFLSFFWSKHLKFVPAGPFLLVLYMKCLSECHDSKKTPLPSQIPVLNSCYTPVLNDLFTGYSTKLLIHKFFGTAL